MEVVHDGRCLIEYIRLNRCDGDSISCHGLWRSAAVVSDHASASRAVVLVEPVLDHVGFTGGDVDARRSVAS
jgi:hypothetical protein